ncbi:hypothetical protein K502DRAFT_343256 [Neoconidiobolus thromboides FSU 785]|nr:hypothetical protein K502DRAFT_343256 [Neoconidiobolus thromboides FSU 785]
MELKEHLFYNLTQPKSTKNNYLWLIYNPLDYLHFNNESADFENYKRDLSSNLWNTIINVIEKHSNIQRCFYSEISGKSFTYQNNGTYIPTKIIDLSQKFYQNENIFTPSSYDIAENKAIISYQQLITKSIRKLNEELNNINKKDRELGFIFHHLNLFHLIKDDEEWFSLDDGNDIRLLLFNAGISIGREWEMELKSRYGIEKIIREQGNTDVIFNVNLYKLSNDAEVYYSKSVHKTKRVNINVYTIPIQELYSRIETLFLIDNELSKVTISNYLTNLQLGEENFIELYSDFSKCNTSMELRKNRNGITLEVKEKQKKELDQLPYSCYHKILIEPDNAVKYELLKKLEKGEYFLFKIGHDFSEIEDLEAINFIQSICIEDPFYYSHMLKMLHNQIYLFCLQKNSKDENNLFIENYCRKDNYVHPASEIFKSILKDDLKNSNGLSTDVLNGEAYHY